MKRMIRLGGLFLLFVPGVLAVSVLTLAPPPKAPSFQEVRGSYRESDRFLLDRRGEAIDSVRTDENGRRLGWVPLSGISPALLKAVIRSEDRRFYGHHGVDWKAAGSALIRNPFARRPRGASTITMQLAALLDRDLRAPKKKKSFGQKWRQVRQAQQIEKGWSKTEILEAYLNLLTFRGELQGVSSASRALFGKDPQGLDDADAEILAAMIPSPNARKEEVAARACALYRAGSFNEDCSRIREKVFQIFLTPIPPDMGPRLAPHAALMVLKKESDRESDPGPLRSTLDGGLQRAALDILRRQLALLKDQNVRDGAILVADNRTGEVLAYVGNGGASSSAPYVDGVRALRQAGSTLKPFLYGLGIEKRVLTPATLLEDLPLDVPGVRGIYRPRNFDKRFEGKVSVRTALASSLNIPAVRTLQFIGLEPFMAELRALGFDELDRSGDFYGPSLALGSADISLWDLVNAYRALANGGIWAPLRLTPREGAKPGIKRRILSREAAFIISDILSSRESRSDTFGLENPLSTPFWSAVKTGTSKDMRDNWCVGYTRNYTVGVWVGNFSGDPMWNVSGITGAAPVWFEIARALSADRSGFPPEAPANLVRARARLEPDEPDRPEWFIAGTEPPDRPGPAPERDPPGILYPVPGMETALDPDIPPDSQAIFFKARSSGQERFWKLDGKNIGSARRDFQWIPCPGNHLLELLDGDGRVADSVRFDVKGRRAATSGCDDGGQSRQKADRVGGEG